MTALAAVGAAKLIARQSPSRIQSVLAWVRSGATGADYHQALAAREDVTAVSRVCSSDWGCLPRSIAAALVCRASGAWPTWRVGVRTVAPFGAHAWIEADGSIVGEPVPAGFFRPLLTVGPADVAESNSDSDSDSDSAVATDSSTDTAVDTADSNSDSDSDSNSGSDSDPDSDPDSGPDSAVAADCSTDTAVNPAIATDSSTDTDFDAADPVDVHSPVDTPIEAP